MTSPRKLLTAWNLRARKDLGQNFLVTSRYARRLAEHAGVDEDEVVVEFGAGFGALTVELARRAARVFAVEKDRRLVPMLRSELLAARIDNVVVLEEDMLRVDLHRLAREEGRRLMVVGNLPYNISSQVVVRLIKNRRAVTRGILLFQKELARRLAAGPGGRDYGRLSVMLGYCAHIAVLADVGAEAFFPRPKIDSQLLALRFHDEHALTAVEENFFFRVVGAAFGRRRKILPNALAGSALGIDGRMARQGLAAAGIDPSRRAETLTVEEFLTLSQALQPRVPS